MRLAIQNRSILRRTASRGQSVFLFAALLPLWLLAMIIVYDFGRFLIMQNQAHILADAAALSGAAALDVRAATGADSGYEAMSGEYVLNPVWARTLAQNSFNKTVADNAEYYPGMDFALTRVSISGAQVEVTVYATVQTTFTKIFGISSWPTIVHSRARAAAGITEDLTQ